MADNVDDGSGGGHRKPEPLAGVDREALAKALRDITKGIDPLLNAGKALRPIQALTDENSPMARIGKQLAEQQRSIGAILPKVHLPDLDRPILPDIPPHPSLETNKRLARIEDRFKEMQEIAARGAQIATDLQAYAAQFLVKFEAAATSTDRAASRAVKVGVAAVIIAIATPVVQTIYSEWWRAPKDAAAAQAVITDMKVEIESLRRAQSEATDRLATALENADQRTAEALREIAKALVTPNQP